MTASTKATLIKVAKWLGAGAFSAGVSLLASPDVINLIPTAEVFLIPVVVIPLLVELDKKLFGKTPSPIPVPALVPAPSAPVPVPPAPQNPSV